MRPILRWFARLLALAWAGYWIYARLSTALLDGASSAGLVVAAINPGMLFLVSVIIAWRWELGGGLLLLFEGALVPIILSGGWFALLTMALPPILAGALLIAVRRRPDRREAEANGDSITPEEP